MQTAAARQLEEVFGTLRGALEELDTHGEAMAALHLAMAVDCLRESMDNEAGANVGTATSVPYLRLVASS
ncbi:hypothetical protein OVA07_13090 [Novosphingobium sp. SL115]|uniref:hypothetical protein n=1 Tax=Novosphingobium sp. SL115 TaxID=2995150 RepID=UPI002275CC82|nr:hypothetical protein [Novosphingobium sp. SL115]MCY1671937.1 hypothetical protein [Novosphingobium sp. SL115]